MCFLLTLQSRYLLVLYIWFCFFSFQLWLRYTPGSSVVENLTTSAGDALPGLGRSPEEGPGEPSQFSCLENSKDRGAWQDIVHGVRKSRTRLSDWAHMPFCIQNIHSVIHGITPPPSPELILQNWNTIPSKQLYMIGKGDAVWYLRRHIFFRVKPQFSPSLCKEP